MVKRYPFPIATHSYFRALNKKSQKRRFLEDPTSYTPKFNYDKEASIESIEQRIAVVQSKEPIIANRLKIVLSSVKLQRDDLAIAEFRAANKAIFTTPTKKLASAILWRISKNVNDTTQSEWDEVIKRIGVVSFESADVEPGSDVFNQYRDYLLRYVTLPKPDDTIIDAIENQLISTGLDKKGWRLRILKNNEHARTYHGAKTISIGESYRVRSKSAARRITVHEVLGHALRGPQSTLAESEGFAILLEQLTKPTFAFRRSYRYLAVGLGWGIFGRRMTFSEVFEIIWRLMVISSKYPPEVAKEHAFDECYRAFRGGKPSVAGAVFLKDAVYFDANIRMWKVLSHRVLTYNEFIECIEGKRGVLA